MELLMWIVVGIVAVLGFVVLVPVLVVGSWFVVITVILGLADGAIWVLDEGWRTVRGRKRRPGVKPAPVKVSMEFQTESRITS
ncbi:MAG TPA: hypothetical protein VE222_11685 [Nitrospiraceae bacterium]|nr:hypothetical protein [Nitrospiraceae bacterium]